MNIVHSDLNERLSDWLRKRIAADHSMIGAHAYFWKSIGVGLVLFGLGVSIGLGFFGYSFVTRKADNMNVLAETFSRALANAKLQGTAEGVVQIEPNEITCIS